jgi:iron complex outermembrane receptor protein
MMNKTSMKAKPAAIDSGAGARPRIGCSMMRPMAAALFTCFTASALAQSAGVISNGSGNANDNTEASLPAVTVETSRSVAEQNQLPVTTASVTAAQIADTVNAMNVEDTLKYLPSVMIRKRYIGDTNAPMATRTTGINAGARTLIYADGILLSTLINNNNGNGSPQWFMVAPEEIARVDVMYGPFSAMYPGNSYGAVTEITTRMPKKFEASAKVSTASQNFNQYGKNDRYPASEVNINLGNRAGDLSWWFSANHLDSFSQPLTYLTIGQSAAAAGGAPVVSGATADRNRLGGPIQILGAGSLTHTMQDTAKIKLAYDFSPTLTAAYTLGFWQNKANTNSQTYLSDASGAPYYGGTGTVNIGGNAYDAGTIAGLFSSNTVEQEHWMQSLSLKTKNQGPWNWEAIATNFYYSKDITRTSSGAYPAAQQSGPGTISDAGGTGWSTLDLNGAWLPKGAASIHSVRFGAHVDEYTLKNPGYNTDDWVDGGEGPLTSDSLGKTRTEALWAQDAWRWTPDVVATIGGRFEWWSAFDGYNLSTGSGTTFAVNQPDIAQSGFSPKLSVAWQANDLWSVTGSFGKALRFPTVGELYQNLQSGPIFLQANPFLKPERVLSGELALERDTDSSKLRVSLFEERVFDALIAQTSTIPGIASPVSFTQNIDSTRQRGVELVAQRNDVLVKGLELNGSVTYVNAIITGNSSYVAPSSTPGATSVGKQTPYVPTWRATAVATYRPNDRWAYTLAGRYSSRMYATVDNTDVNTSTYQGFDAYFVADARMSYRVDKHWSVAAGVDNIANRQYFLFHPFPERTVFAELKYQY